MTPSVGPEPGNTFGQGKNLPLIPLAHHIPYVATASVANLHDLEYKVEKATSIRGARYIHVHVPCPLGWGSEPHDTIKVARAAGESGLFPLLEAEFGDITARTPIRRPQPVDDYLKLQKRFAHRFRPVRDEIRLAAIQSIANRNIQRFGLFQRSPGNGETIRHHARRRLELSQPRWLVAHAAASLRGSPAALQIGLPGGRRHPGLAVLYYAESGASFSAWKSLVEKNPLPAIMGRVCYHPCELGCNRAQLDQSVNIHAVERFLGDEAIRRGWQFSAGAPSGKHALVVGSGPSGLSAAYHLAGFGRRVTIYEAGPAAGGMMHFLIPKSTGCRAKSCTQR